MFDLFQNICGVFTAAKPGSCEPGFFCHFFVLNGGYLSAFRRYLFQARDCEAQVMFQHQRCHCGLIPHDDRNAAGQEKAYPVWRVHPEVASEGAGAGVGGRSVPEESVGALHVIDKIVGLEGSAVCYPAWNTGLSGSI